MSESPYTMTLSLNLLNHLGINLYSNVPAVLSEVVANAWDADAKKVVVCINKTGKEIVITDDGDGMNLDDINRKYLTIGFRRRDEPNGAVTANLHRPVMGRKGIGKLSLFSISRDITIFTIKDGEKHAFQMLLSDIQAKIDNHETEYKPTQLSSNKFPTDLKKGTRIVLADLKKTLGHAESALRKRLARRFSILGEKNKFSLIINERVVTIADRGYFGKLQYLWYYGDKTGLPLEHAKNLEFEKKRPNIIKVVDTETEAGKKGAKKAKVAEYSIQGWIGTVKESGALKDADDNLNKLVIMVRGKMAQEDILEDFNEGGMYTKYLIGELHADFLDLDKKPDITTSSRQRIIEDDARYAALREFVYGELKNIQNGWTALRNEKGTEEALLIPAIQQWFKALGPDAKRHAKVLFGKINQIPFEFPDDKKRIFKYGILAFEHLRYKQNLNALHEISPENIEQIGEIFSQLDDIEASLYHQIISGRIEVIEALQAKVGKNELENVIRDYIAEHLWLLDPAWERATDSEFVESSLKKQFLDFAGKLTAEEKKGRLDIKYSTFTGTHVIIELKRPNRPVTEGELINQGDKYQNGLKKLLDQHGRGNESIEVVFLIGNWPKYWEDKEQRRKNRESLRQKNMRVLLYSELLANANRIYKQYLKKREETGRIQQLLNSIEKAELPE
jgi:hypothetical protein